MTLGKEPWNRPKRYPDGLSSFKDGTNLKTPGSARAGFQVDQFDMGNLKLVFVLLVITWIPCRTGSQPANRFLGFLAYV